mmetsp:Transcript_32040/g.85088  ORF Transcript_32040/g.85088 Transcript_32040/m.85088 type:complete len:166 (-) Transcript_32040:102-599(-)
MAALGRLLALASALVAGALGGRASRSEAVRKMVAARGLASQGLPDPHCHTGVISLKVEGEAQVCCAGYCGECTDYPTCGFVRGQNSTNACCKTKVYESRCGTAPANVCLKSCSESVPPCIMEDGETFTTPDPNAVSAGSDCGEAVKDWHAQADAAIESASAAPAP